MRGAPLHLCHRNHLTIAYTGDACPYCAVLAALREREAEVGRLKLHVLTLTRQLKEATRCDS